MVVSRGDALCTSMRPEMNKQMAKRYKLFSTATASFDLDEDQVRLANQWALRHKCKTAGQYGTAGEKYSFRFLPTGIGTFVDVKCSCGAEKDLSMSENF